MGFSFKRKVYESAPLVVKRAISAIPFGWIAGRAYREALARNDFFDLASRNEIRSYQEQVLARMLRFATEQVPAYASLKGVVERLPALEALKAFPLLDKKTLQENRESYLPRNFETISHYPITTGGTSGNQLKFYVDDDSQSLETAFVHRLWRRVGYTPKCRKATFRGVPFANLPPGVYWQHNPIYNELQLSPFHLNNVSADAYIKEILKYNPSYFHGYPSAIDYLAKHILARRQIGDFKNVKAIFLVSEGFTEEQRQRIEKAFSSRVFSFYGHSERVVMGGECEKNSTYHHFPDYGILELIDAEGMGCDREGERGEIVGTGLLNRCLPLIRYRTGDFAVRCEHTCSCGRNWDRFTSVEGRWNQEMVIGKNDAKISIAALNMHGYIFDNVLRYQYYQHTVGECDLRIMVNDRFTERDKETIEKAYRAKIGNDFTISVKVVNDIPLTERGKTRMFVSKFC